MKKSIDMLLNEVGHLSLYKSHLKLGKLDLYKGQPPLLEILFEKDGITQKEILEQLRVTKATISKTISRMVAKGFLIMADAILVNFSEKEKKDFENLLKKVRKNLL